MQRRHLPQGREEHAHLRPVHRGLLHGHRPRPRLPVHLPHARRGRAQGRVLRAVHHEHRGGGRGLDLPLQPALRAVQQHPGDASACPGAAGSPPARTRWRASSSSASGRRSATTWSSSSRACRTSPRASTRRRSSTAPAAIRRFFAISLPLVAPTAIFVVMYNTILALKVFDQVFVLTAGGPADATTVVVLQIYKQAFENYRFGYAASMAFVLFVIIISDHRRPVPAEQALGGHLLMRAHPPRRPGGQEHRVPPAHRLRDHHGDALLLDDRELAAHAAEPRGLPPEVVAPARRAHPLPERALPRRRSSSTTATASSSRSSPWACPSSWGSSPGTRSPSTPSR